MSVIEQLNRKSQYSNTTAIDTFLVLHFKEATQVDAGIDIFLNRLNVFNCWLVLCTENILNMVQRL